MSRKNLDLLRIYLSRAWEAGFNQGFTAKVSNLEPTKVMTNANLDVTALLDQFRTQTKRKDRR